ncbi:cytosine/adenosine deaminase-related metal-dependent hydrolase [Roseiarcus fermentans]|uniref:Cytosine/adenosine deaminase-related metal-dependent hydrolase n=1 Tax=Roseiarcus fermentans TaxID=1473586 RepID=A0A366FLH7_9HYPH|nr:amidohydrolase family protein [Roseiarcus fermentans]RBP15512.1 cytosine/adenosine deaminase-related metal-dependent hydrolase [Roseiarcus fermentans]
MTENRILIRGASILSMDPRIGDFGKGDILIEGETIAAVAPTISVDTGAVELVDAESMIAIPGFVDTHRHTWQTQLRTVAVDWSLCDYVINMRSIFAAFYRPEDVFLGNYVGCLEAVNGGITSVVDHCHIINSPDHADEAVRGIFESGVGGVFCYGMFRNAKHQIGAPIEVGELIGEMFSDVEDWRFDDGERVRDRYFHKDGRVRFGVATNEYEFKPYDEVRSELSRIRLLDPHRISMHMAMGALCKDARMVRYFAEDRFLDEKCLFVHGGGFTDQELRLLAEFGCSVSATPDTEMQMGMGHPVGYRFASLGGKASLGIDIVSNIAGDMFSQMRLQLQAQRARVNARDELEGRMPGLVSPATRSALEMATIGGARAAGLDSVTGSLTPGKKADIALISGRDINTAPVIDPVGTVVFYANPSNVDSVWVHGRALKRNGALLGVDWPHWRRRLVASTEHVMANAQRIPLEKIQNLWTALWAFDRRSTVWPE